jgi:hypothetical protein
MPDVGRNRRGHPIVTLYSTSNSLIKLVEDHFRGEDVELVVYTEPAEFDYSAVDLVLTKNQLSAELEKFAAGMGGMVCVLPESLDWILDRCKAGKVGAMMSAEIRTKINRWAA